MARNVFWARWSRDEALPPEGGRVWEGGPDLLLRAEGAHAGSVRASTIEELELPLGVRAEPA